ncbi:MAG TPA: hypothetical protein VGK89_00975 [Candidatus Eisenbacteria bacterium]|jgi:hypothetical protein
MAAKKWLVYLLCAAGAVLALFIVVAVIGFLIGSGAPDHVSFVWAARFEESPDQIWSALKLPPRRTQVRERADGVRYEAEPGDRMGSLILLYEPTSRIVSHYGSPTVEIWRVDTFIPDHGGTSVRVEDSAYLRGPWHRLLFPSLVKKQGKARLRQYGNALGHPGLEINEGNAPRQPGSGRP